MLIRWADDAETVNHIIGNKLCVAAANFRMMEIVIAAAIANI